MTFTKWGIKILLEDYSPFSYHFLLATYCRKMKSIPVTPPTGTSALASNIVLFPSMQHTYTFHSPFDKRQSQTTAVLSSGLMAREGRYKNLFILKGDFNIDNAKWLEKKKSSLRSLEKIHRLGSADLVPSCSVILSFHFFTLTGELPVYVFHLNRQRSTYTSPLSMQDLLNAKFCPCAVRTIRGATNQLSHLLQRFLQLQSSLLIGFP